MSTTTKPDRIAQRDSALVRANSVRLGQAALRRELGSKPRPKGQKQLAKIIETTTDEAHLRARVGYLLCSVRGRGKHASTTTLRRVGISPTKRLGDLTERQRRVLSKAVTLPLSKLTDDLRLARVAV